MTSPHRSIAIAFGAAAALAAGAGCSLDARHLLQNFDGEEVQGAVVKDLDLLETPPTLDGSTFVGTLGPSDIGAGEYSGASFTLYGTGERVCVIIDPQSVFDDNVQRGADGSEEPNPFMEDFPHDDGDVDMLAGLASYYTGTPGEAIGDFFGSFPDSNGVERAVDLNLCLQEDYHGQVGGTAGRATPEACSFETLEDTAYRVVLQVFSVPIDDNELKYSLEVRNGECPPVIDECTLRGDYDDHPEANLPSGFDNVEDMYCGDS